MTSRIVKVILRGEIGDLRGKMTAAARSIGDVADKATAAGKESEKFRRGLDELGSTAGRFGLVAAGGLGAMVLAASNFESAMSDVQAATHESARNMELLREAAIQAGADTAFSASEAAAGIENLAKAGVATKDILAGGLQGALDLAAAGSIDVAAAAEAAATAMTQFGLAGTEVPHVADLLSAAAGKAQGEVSDMNFALAQSGLVANQVGLSIEETAGGLAAFASAGLLGSDAGTSFKTMLGALTPNSDKAAETMSQLGISAYDAQGNFVGLAEFAGRLQAAMKDLTNEQRQAKLETIFGSDAVRAASVLYEQGEEGIRGWISAVDDQGFAAETAAIKMDNLKGDLEALGGSIETALIGMGEGSQGPLRELVQGLTRVVNAFGGLPPAAQGTVTALLGITAITGGSLWFGSKVIRGISDTRDAMSALRESSDRAGRALDRTGRVMRTGLKVGGVLTAVVALDAAFDSMFSKKLDGSNLDRSLTALADGRIEGALRDAFGANLGDIGEKVAQAVDFMNSPGFAQGLGKIGLFGLDLGNGAAAAADSIGTLDEALATMVESQRGDEAADLFARIVEAAEDSGTSVDVVREAFAQYQLALQNLNPPMTGVGGAFNFLNGALEQLPTSTSNAAVASERLAAEQKKAKDESAKLRAEIRKQSEALGGLGGDLNDSEVSFQEWMEGLEKRAEAIENFTRNIESASKKGIPTALIQEFVAEGENGMLRLNELVNETPGNIDRTVQAWRDQRAAIRENAEAVEGVIEKAEELKRKAEEKKRIRLETDEAMRKGSELIRMLKEIPDERVNIWLDYKTGTRPDGVGPGSTLGGVPTFATGGWTGPGAKYQPAGVVHADEYVFSKEATQGNVAMLDILHRQLRGYAAGGYVGRAPAAAGMGMGIDYDRLAQAVARARPLYGDVIWKGTYEDFKRMAQADNELAAIGGL